MSRVLAFALAASLLAACAAPAGSPWIPDPTATAVVVASPTTPPATPAPGQPTPRPPAPAPTAAPPAGAGRCDGDGMSVTGPAIAQFGPPATVVRVNAGQAFAMPIAGSCWGLPSQEALVGRWAAHLNEFRAMYPGPIQVVER